MWLGEYRDEFDFPCPTKAEAIDWLESKGMVIEIIYLIFGQVWCYNVFVLSTRDSHSPESFPTRLEAEEAAIIKALELL